MSSAGSGNGVFGAAREKDAPARTRIGSKELRLNILFTYFNRLFESRPGWVTSIPDFLQCSPDWQEYGRRPALRKVIGDTVRMRRRCKNLCHSGPIEVLPSAGPVQDRGFRLRPDSANPIFP